MEVYSLSLSRIQWANCAGIEETENPAPSFTDLSCPAGKIPEEAKALSLLAPSTPVPSLIPGGGLLPIPAPDPLQNVSLLSFCVAAHARQARRCCLSHSWTFQSWIGCRPAWTSRRLCPLSFPSWGTWILQRLMRSGAPSMSATWTLR